MLIRPTWIDVDRPAAFLAWLDVLDAGAVTVLNPTSLVRWNAHKRYLVELEARGVAVVPTELVVRGATTTPDDVRVRRRWTDVVVKPAVGGSHAAPEVAA